MALKNKTHYIERVSTVQRTSQRTARTASEHDPSTHHAVVLQRAMTSQPSVLRPKDVLALQRTVGNRAVRQILQAKLAVGPANDHYEREADHVAASIMREPAAHQIQRQGLEEEDTIQTKSLASTITPLIQRQELDEEEESPVQTKSDTIQREETSDEDEEENPVQLRSDGGLPSVKPGMEHTIERARGGGRPLPDVLLARMEQSFGVDFSGVRVHSDSQSDTLNRSLNARAFTTGHDLFFRRGEYNPESRRGQELIAHELTHVVQQNGGMSGKKNLSLKRSTSTVIQRGPWDWLKEKFGGVREYADEQRGEFKRDVKGKYGNKDNKEGEEHRRINYNEDLAPDVGNYVLLGGSGGTAAGKAITDRVNVIKTGSDFFTDSTPLMSPVGQSLSIAGAVSAGVGVIPAAVDAHKGLKQWRDESYTKGQRELGLGLGSSGLGNVAQQAGTTLFHTANKYGSTALAAGAEIGTGAAAVLTGAVDIGRGAFAIRLANLNIKRLQDLQKTKDHAVIPTAAKQAESTQKLRKSTAAYTIGKGALTALGGLMLLGSATTPLGWLLIGVGALVGLKGVYNKWRDKKKRREAIVSELLGISEEQKSWRSRLEALEGPWYLPGKSIYNRKEIAALGPSPIEERVKTDGFVSVDHYYSNYISATADELHALGKKQRKKFERQVEKWLARWDRFERRIRRTERKYIKANLKNMSYAEIVTLHGAGFLREHVYSQIVKLLISMGLRAHFEKSPPEPTPEKIGKALHE